ncbi:hypothetical protein HZC08_01600 [Candidatus Micrarchaeota archaeon]|nr:hypothetical protein [Candidatus Micrarchaeota archaeon]
MKSKGFIFSLDAFVAFTLALIIIYTLVFFSSIPYAYYSGLMQAHYLAKDSLHSLSIAKGPVDGMSKLDYLVLFDAPDSTKSDSIKQDLDLLIPEQFGYTLEYYLEDNSGQKTWTEVYSTKNDDSTKHNKVYKKLSTTAYALVFNYENADPKLIEAENPFGYITCKGVLTQCNPPESEYGKGNSAIRLVRLIVFI